MNAGARAWPVLIAFEGGEGVGQVDPDRRAGRRAARRAAAAVRGQPRARRDRGRAAHPRAGAAHRRRRSRRGPRRCCSPPTGPSTCTPSSVRRSLPGRSCCPTGSSTRRWPTRVPGANWPPTTCAGSRLGPPTACVPDLTVLLDLPVARRAGPGPRAAATPTGSKRESLEFHERVRQAFLDAGRGRARPLPGARCRPSDRRAGRTRSPPAVATESTYAGARAMTDVWSRPGRAAPRRSAMLRRRAAAAAQVAAGEQVAGRVDEPRLAVHRAGRLGSFGGGPGAGRGACSATATGAPGCGVCSACRTVLAGTHPDVRLVVPEGLSISVADIRGVVATAARLPALGRWQVVVIEDADRMTEGASNALLKAIEEPPARTIFLLCAPSTHPDDVSVTIRSRCRLVSLRTPPADAVAAVLDRRRGRRRRPRRGRPRPRRAMSDGRGGWPATSEARARRATVLAIPASLRSLRRLRRRGRPAGAVGRGRGRPRSRPSSTPTRRRRCRRPWGPGRPAGAPPPRCAASAGVIKDLEKRQRSRATRTQRDALDRALVDLAALLPRRAAGPGRVRRGRSRIPTSTTRCGRWRTSLTRPGRCSCLDAVLACRLALEQNVKPIIAVQAMTAALRLPAA